MQPTATWGTPTGYYLGLNMRTGASDLSNADFNDYPAFILGLNNNFSLSDKGIVQSFIETDILQLNTPITDWSIAYTAVDNPELGQSNVGVYLSDPNTPAYTTNPVNYAKIAFLSSYSYTTILDNIRVNIPRFTNFTLDFWSPPYSNSRKIWSPNAAPKSGSNDMGVVYQQSNYNGYANIIYSFGVKSLFLEIHVDTLNINTMNVDHYTLKAYNALTTAEKAEKPIAKAYALVYRRANTNGTYTYASGDNRDNFRLVLSEPLHGENDGGGIYDYYINTTAFIGLTEPLTLPIFGNYKDNITNVVYNNVENGGTLFYGHNKVDNVIVSHEGGDERFTFYTMQGTDYNIEWIRRTCAAYGLFFCDDIITDELDDLSASSTENTRWTNDEMMLGIIESDGYTRGRYSHGADNANQSQFNWTDSTESTFIPSVTPTPTENEYDTHTVFNTISDTATLFKRYVLNDTNVRQLGLDLFDVCDDIAGDDPDEPFKNYAAMINSNFLTNNPIDCIISLQRFPMSIPKDDNSPENIKLGRVSVNAIGYETTQTNYEYSFTGKTIYPCFGDSFLDYNPYTTYELYIPFCGTVRLDPADILYRQLNVYLNVDFSTGTCTGYVMSDNLVIETVSGNIAIDIPVTGIASATVNANLNNAIVAYQNSKIKQIENIAGTIGYGIKAGAGVMKFAATGDTDNLSFGGGFRQIMDDVRGNISGDKANYDLQHQIVSPHVIGSASSVGLWAIDLNCRLICYYPTGDVIDVIGGKPQFTNKIYNYGIQNGFATVETNTIASYQTGLVVGVNPLLYNITTANGRPATQTELDMIENAIKEGVILPPVG